MGLCLSGSYTESLHLTVSTLYLWERPRRKSQHKHYTASKHLFWELFESSQNNNYFEMWGSKCWYTSEEISGCVRPETNAALMSTRFVSLIHRYTSSFPWNTHLPLFKAFHGKISQDESHLSHMNKWIKGHMKYKDALPSICPEIRRKTRNPLRVRWAQTRCLFPLSWRTGSDTTCHFVGHSHLDLSDRTCCFHIPQTWTKEYDQIFDF